MCRYQRLLAQEYDRKLKEAKRKGKIRFNVHETVDGQTIDIHTSQSSLLGRETSTPSVSTSGFNYNDFVAETGQSGASGVLLLQGTCAVRWSTTLFFLDKSGMSQHIHTLL